jgi:hypothetical protein
LKFWEAFGGHRAKAKSFWIGHDHEPRCRLEAFAKSVALAHCASDDWVGVEFWVQKRHYSMNSVNSVFEPNTAGLDFHFDKDEKRLAELNEWAHPVWSTVTYLTCNEKNRTGRELVRIQGADVQVRLPNLVPSDDSNGDSTTNPPEEKKADTQQGRIQQGGAPLVVFDTTVSRPSITRTTLSFGDTWAKSRLRTVELPGDGSSPLRAWVVFANKRTHAVFPGDRLHGVPCELLPLLYPKAEGRESRKKKGDQAETILGRLSLLVNIWHHRPRELHRLPASFVRSLRGDSQVNFGDCTLGSLAPAACLERVDVELSSEDSRETRTSRGNARSDLVWLREHRQGDLGPLPLKPLVAARHRGSCGLKIEYHTYHGQEEFV